MKEIQTESCWSSTQTMEWNKKVVQDRKEEFSRETETLKVNQSKIRKAKNKTNKTWVKYISSVESLTHRRTQGEDSLCELEEKVEEMEQLNMYKDKIIRGFQWEVQEKSATMRNEIYG